MANVFKVVNGKVIEESEDIIREIPCLFCCYQIMFLYPKCVAFPEGIPAEIRSYGLSDHTLPMSSLPGYSGLMEKLDLDTGMPLIFKPLAKMSKEPRRVYFDHSASLDDMASAMMALVQEGQREAQRQEQAKNQQKKDE